MNALNANAKRKRGLKGEYAFGPGDRDQRAEPKERPYDSYPVAVLNAHGAEIGRRDFDTGPPCTTSPPCGHCWYCKRREAQP